MSPIPEEISASLKNQKIAVLSITGPYRSGKSFLANLIMNKMAGFKVGSTINACTKGLWVWGRPIPLENGRSLVVIDCEGLGSVEKDRTGNIDMKLFTLSVLLSSTIIYNTKHAISEDKIEELSNAANLTKRINIAKDDKKSIGLRISPFGEIIEEITFSGEILQAEECNFGILIVFTDSSIGLCSIENNIAVSKWIKKAGEKSNICAVISRDNKCALIAENKPDTEIYILNIKNGELEKKFCINSFNPKELTLWQKTDRGFFITDLKKAVEFDCDGTIFWEAFLPQKNKWNYVTYTKNNSLVICRNNWVIDSYKMNQDISVKRAKEQKKVKKYEDFYKNKKLKSSVFSKMTVNQLEEIEIILENGDYEKKEEEILFLLQQELDCYINDLLKNSNPHLRGMPSYYTLNPLYTEKLLLCASKTQTDNFTDEFSKLLELEQDYSAKNIILNCIKNIKYDRNGQILETFLKIIDRGSANRNLTWFLICDDTGIIANFMGKPALYRQGKSILTQFMYPEYSREIRDYAGKTLAKMMELDF